MDDAQYFLLNSYISSILYFLSFIDKIIYKKCVPFIRNASSFRWKLPSNKINVIFLPKRIVKLHCFKVEKLKNLFFFSQQSYVFWIMVYYVRTVFMTFLYFSVVCQNWKNIILWICVLKRKIPAQMDLIPVLHLVEKQNPVQILPHCLVVRSGRVVGLILGFHRISLRVHLWIIIRGDCFMFYLMEILIL